MFLLATVLLCLWAPSARAAEPEPETHVFNGALSLTGDCSTSEKLDPIPDPGCPGGLHPPAGPFANPSSVSTDPYGDIYVASAGPKEAFGAIDPTGGHIDVFDASGNFLTELAVPGAQVIAVGSSGALYVGTQCLDNTSCAGIKFLRFDPSKYVPAAGEIEYGNAPVQLHQTENEYGTKFKITGIAVNPTNQHLFASSGGQIIEYGPPVPGAPNEVIEEGITYSNPAESTGGLGSLALDVAHNLLYAAQSVEELRGSKVRVFEMAAPHALLRTIDGSTTPAGKFISAVGELAVAIEEATGNVFVADTYQSNRVYEFEEDGSYVGTFKHGFESLIPGIHVDNSPESPNEGYLFVPSGSSPPGHVFAFQPKPEAHPPIIESVSVSGVGEREAAAEAVINPAGSATHYVFEYTPQGRFEEAGFSGALIAGEGNIASGVAGVEVSAALAGLSPGTAYRFRVRTESQCLPGGCSSEKEGSFTTFPATLQEETCANAPLRVGASASLPDCRVYELVTPPNTNGHPPLGPTSGAGPSFGVFPVRGDGNALAFRILGGPIPGTNGAGGFNGDAYLATRSSAGWGIETQSPTGEQNVTPSPGALSPDLAYMGWHFGGELGGPGTGEYVRYPDGTFHLIGEGVLANDQQPDVAYISQAGGHIIFSSIKRLIAAAPEGTDLKIYDRTSDGVLHVVSLLPGDVAPAAGLSAEYEGRSDDGSSIAFELNALYVRVDNVETLVASPKGGEFAGFSADGRYLFYVVGGDFFRFDVQTQETVKITGSEDAEPVNIPSQGSSAFFISMKKLVNGPNPIGAKALPGQPNLYRWDGGKNQFVGTLSPEDETGFNEWMVQVGRDQLGFDPTRSNPTGSTLLFRSRAPLTGEDVNGHAEIYRYDAAGTLVCISCNPTGTPAHTDASLATPLTHSHLTANLSEDGRRAFFESSERLVASDNDGLQDVYEWEDEGKGTCRQPGGCLFLVSSGQSGRPNYFYGASASGDDVAFSSSDLLTAEDQDETPSIYDARVEGGFPAPAGRSSECLGEACQPAAKAPPVVTPASSIFQGAGNVKRSSGCPKGKHRQLVHGKTRCVGRRHHRRQHHKRPSHTQGRAAR